jgi:hypothetical protein
MTFRAPLLTAAGCLAAAVLGAAPAFATVSPPAPAQLSHASCVHARDPLARTLNVTAVMRPVAGTQRLQVRFDLSRALHRHGHYRPVKGTNLGVWISPSDATLGQHPADVWRVSHPIEGLEAPAFYRLAVTFRWLGAGGSDLASQTLTAPICHQVELRPDLSVTSIVAIVPITDEPGQDTYSAIVRNNGVSPAGAFNVGLQLGTGPAAATVALSGMAARTQRRVTFVAPACTAGQTVTVTADSGYNVDDATRSNNSLSVVCPTPATAASTLHLVKQ